MIDPLSLSIPLEQSGPTSEPKPTRSLLQPSPSHPDDYILELDYSSTSDFLCCPRSAENKLIRQREANRDASATDFGKLFHTCEELRLRAGLSPATVTAQHELVAAHFLHHPVAPSDHRTSARMIDILHLYNDRYATDGWVEKVHQHDGLPMIERPFKLELCTVPVNAKIPYSKSRLVADVGGPAYNDATIFPVRKLHVLFTGRIDAVLSDSNLLWVVDHKTSSRGGREFEEAFRLSLQTRGYCYAAQQLLGVPIAGLIMNAVIVRPLTKTGTGTEFDRKSYFYSPDSLEEWRQNMLAIVSDFVAMLVRGYFPQHSRSFISPCAHCDFAENCTLPPEQRAMDLASDLYRDITWSPID